MNNKYNTKTRRRKSRNLPLLHLSPFHSPKVSCSHSPPPHSLMHTHAHTQSKPLGPKPEFLHLHLSLYHGCGWGATDDFTSSFLHFSLFSTALWDLANSRPAHSLMSSHLFLCLPCLLPPFTVPCKMVLARPDEQDTCPYLFSLHLFTMIRRSLCGLIACWILAQTSSLATWSLHEMCSILR